MWFRKKAVEGDEYPECVGCGCLMREARREVEVQRGSPYDSTGNTIAYYTSPQSSIECFCDRCAPPYDLKTWEGDEAHYYLKESSKNIEVTEKGKLVKGGE
jgi:hypothetical protein